MADPTAEATRLREQVQLRADAIAQDTDRTIESRTRDMQALYNENQPKMEALFSEYQDHLTGEVKKIEKAAYAAPAENEAGNRQALDRAQAAMEKASDYESTKAALEALLEVAELTGDETQAWAVFVMAERNGYTQVANAYLADRPQRAETVQEMRQSGGNGVVRRVMSDIQTSFTFSLPTRPNLQLTKQQSWSGYR